MLGVDRDAVGEFLRFVMGEDSLDCYLYKQYNQCEHGVEHGSYCPECM